MTFKTKDFNVLNNIANITYLMFLVKPIFLIRARFQAAYYNSRRGLLAQFVHQDHRLGNLFHGTAGIHAFFMDHAVGGFFT
jgi:hypothetical protein